MAEKKITKAEIIDSVYDNTGVNRKDVKVVFDMVFASIKEALVKRHVIELRGFGTFEIKIRRGRQKARNPKTGEIVSVNSHGTACFRPGRDLKSAVWKLGAEETEDVKNGVILDGADNSGVIENSIGGGT